MNPSVELTDAFLAKIAGWQVMKQARGFIERNLVIESSWSPPVLKGIVQDGTVSYKSGLVVKGTIDIDNLCSCRESRQRGIVCAHSVSIGLHHLKVPAPGASSQSSSNASSDRNRKGNLRASNKDVKKPLKLGKRLLRSNSDQPGEAVRISIIVPPNFLQAIEKSRTTICFEAEWKRGRCPLNSLPFSERFEFSEQDSILLDHIENVAEGDTPGMLSLNGEGFLELLNHLSEHPRIYSGRSHGLKVGSTPKRISITATLEKNGEIEFQLKDRLPQQRLIEGATSWIYDQNTFYPIALPSGFQGVFQGPVRFGRDRVPHVLSQDWELLSRHCEMSANFRLEDFVVEALNPTFRLGLVGGLSRLEAHLECAYGDQRISFGDSTQAASIWMADPKISTRYWTRDWQAEQQALETLRCCGFSGPNDQGRFQLFGQNGVLNFFSRDFPRIEKEWAVTLEERLERSTSQNLERIEPQLRVTPSGEQWFDFGVSFATDGGEQFSAADIQRLILSGQSHTRLKNGRIGLLDTGAVEELQEVLLDCSPTQDANGYRIQNTQAGFLEATIRERTPWQFKAPREWKRERLKASGEVKFEAPDAGEIADKLRCYQTEGVAWLWFIRTNNFGGILADEMGLGKTVQTLALLNAVRIARVPSERKPSLVLCPTSLVYNWVDEAKKFTKDLNVVALQGPQRSEHFDKIQSADLVVTSYALIRRDAEVYRKIEFDTVILDEAQHIKNRQTQNAQAVKSIRSRHRLVLTGTPLENSVLDLWSIFDFLMPGYLGTATEFRERYEVPIVREKSASVQSRLARRVRPFLLRRMKRDVVKELPEKIENVSYCELKPDQHQLYQQVLETGRREILDAAGANGVQKSRMIVLNTLLRLRQICCDMRLLKLETNEASATSGKLDLFEELLDEVLDGGHRVLVFSQFVSMLSLIRERLDASEIDYCYLDGHVTNRKEVVDKFQRNTQIPVFLISLKAGGVGLNLTGADTVIHFDPWWNPAVEDQASDRAHRIGQTRVVTVYRLIARGTVEEKILNMQSRKRAMIGGILADDEQAGESLTWDEIQELLT